MTSETDGAASKATIECAMTGLPATTAKVLSKPMRRLLPPATMMAESIRKKGNAERPTPNVQRRMPQTIRCSAFGVRRSAFSLQLFLHFLTQSLPIRPAGDLALQRLHDDAHLGTGSGANFSNRLAHRLSQFFAAHRLRQIS